MRPQPVVREPGRAWAEPARRSCPSPRASSPSRTPPSCGASCRSIAGRDDPPADAQRLARQRQRRQPRHASTAARCMDLMKTRSLRHALVLSWTGSPAPGRVRGARCGNDPDRLPDQRAGHDLGAGSQAVRLGRQQPPHGHDRHAGHHRQRARRQRRGGGARSCSTSSPGPNWQTPTRHGQGTDETGPAGRRRRSRQRKDAAQEAGLEYTRMPCLGHPVFRNEPVNYDPREQVDRRILSGAGRAQRVPGLLPRPGAGPEGQRLHPQRAGRQRGRRRGLRVAGASAGGSCGTGR